MLIAGVAVTFAAACADVFGIHEGVTDGGSVDDSGPEAGSPKDIRQLAVGSEAACVLRWGGDVVCWGGDNSAELGHDVSGDQGCVFGALDAGLIAACDPTPSVVDKIDAATRIAIGDRAACAAMDDGSASCWGLNTTEQLGHVQGASVADTTCPIFDAAVVPQPFPCNPVPFAVAGLSAKMIARGSGATCATTATNVVCWGDNAYLQLVQPDAASEGGTTNLIEILSTPASDISMSIYPVDRACAIVGGMVDCWGGINSPAWPPANGNCDAAPCEVTYEGGAPLTAVSRVATLRLATCALVQGAVLCWGSNSDGTLGASLNASTPFPQSASYITQAAGPVADIAGNFNHLLVLDALGGVWGLGDNSRAEITQPTSSACPSATCAKPVNIPLPAKAILIAAGAFVSLAETADGKLWAWGRNDVGQLGHAPGTSGDILCDGVYCNPVPTLVTLP